MFSIQRSFGVIVNFIPNLHPSTFRERNDFDFVIGDIQAIHRQLRSDFRPGDVTDLGAAVGREVDENVDHCSDFVELIADCGWSDVFALEVRMEDVGQVVSVTCTGEFFNIHKLLM